jgi:hypothetical protein
MTNALKMSGRYPPTLQQRGTIAMLINSPLAEPAYLDLKLAFLVSPKIDLRRLERTFAKFTDRHDSLRQSFDQQGEEWVVNVWSRHRTGLIVEDHGDLTDANFHGLVHRHSSIRIGLLDDVLFQAIVLRCGQRGDVLFIRCHHAISDGHSMIVVIEE